MVLELTSKILSSVEVLGTKVIDEVLDHQLIQEISHWKFQCQWEIDMTHMMPRGLSILLNQGDQVELLINWENELKMNATEENKEKKIEKTDMMMKNAKEEEETGTKMLITMIMITNQINL